MSEYPIASDVMKLAYAVYIAIKGVPDVADFSEAHVRKDVDVIARALASMDKDAGRVRRGIKMAMGCLNPGSRSFDERLAWFRLSDVLNGYEPRSIPEVDAPLPPAPHTSE